MRVLHVHLSTEFAGSERYCASLARLQAKAGKDVLVVVRGAGFGEKERNRVLRWRQEAAPAQVVVIPCWIPAALHGWVLRKIMSGFGKKSIVHTHLGRANLRGGRAAKKLGIPWVATVHLRWKGKEMAAADGVICIAAWQKKEIPAAYKRLVEVVWNWAPPRKDVGVGEVAYLRQVWGADEKTFVFGSVGRLHPQKGMDVLIRAFRQAFSLADNVRLVLVGEGDKRKELEELAAGDARIMLPGYLERVEAGYAAMDAYVSAARYEPFGLTILEAMEAGCPVVCTRTEGPMEFLAACGHVEWAEKADVASLAAALRRAFEAGKRRITYDMVPFAVARAEEEIAKVYSTILARVAD